MCAFCDVITNILFSSSILMQAHEFLSDGVVGKQIVSGLLRLPRCCGPVHLTKLPRGCRGWSGSAKSQVILPMKYTVETGYKISIKSLKRKFGSVIMSAFYCILYYIGWLNFLVHHDHWVAHICWHFALRSWSRQCCSNTWAKRVTYGELTIRLEHMSESINNTI